MASGWNLWVWLECIGVVSWCCCKEVYRFPHNITYPYSTCISSFLQQQQQQQQQHSYFFVYFKNIFSFLFVIFVQYSKHCSKNNQNRSKIEITRTWRYNYIDKNMHVR